MVRVIIPIQRTKPNLTKPDDGDDDDNLDNCWMDYHKTLHTHSLSLKMNPNDILMSPCDWHFLLFHLNSTLKHTAPFDCFLAASYLSLDLILPLLPVFMLSYAKWLLAVALDMWTDMSVILIISSNPITSSASLHVCKCVLKLFYEWQIPRLIT